MSPAIYAIEYHLISIGPKEKIIGSIFGKVILNSPLFVNY
tara:strand:+ start:499 stop:618 length:120 start_codon:yes stop_codon:yes gene_type:complete